MKSQYGPPTHGFLASLVRGSGAAIALALVFLAALVFGAGTARADVASELSLRNDSFLSPAYNSANQTSYQFLGASFQTEKTATDPLRVDLQGAYAAGAPLLSYINVKEFSYCIDASDDQSFTFGRHHVRWSELDRRWQFGLIEPVFKWNPLAPESQGLTGLFWDVKWQNVKFGLFGSFLYLPNQGPSFSIDADGQFTRGNPWFRNPPESIKVLSQVSQIEYHFDRPNESQVVTQTSYGGHVEFGDETPYRLRLASLYKPMNELALGYDGSLDIARNRGEVEIEPQVVYHNISSADAYYQSKRLRFGVSAAYDRPSKDNPFEDRWTHPVYSDATLISPFVDVLVARGWTLSVQHLDVNGGNVTEAGALASDDRPSISSRYPFQQANEIALEVDHHLPRSRRISVKTSYTQSEKNEFRLIRADARLELSRAWNVQSSLQLVDAAELTKDNRNEISEYSNNDQLQVGLGYVF